MQSQTNTVANNMPRGFTKPIWVSPSEAGRLASIGRTRVYELMADGTLKSIKIGRRRLVSYASLEALGDARGG